MNIFKAITARRSVRAFLDRELPVDVLNRLLEAARLAPSAKNFQEWRFVVVRERAMRQQLAQAAKGQTFVGEAPVVLACCAVTDGYVMTCGQACYPIDLAIAIDHITLCAAAEGLGTCWIGAFYEEEVKKLLRIPPQVRVVSLLPIGYPADQAPVTKQRLPFTEIVFQETWK
ncbi:MAG: nitroreductase family protein [Deltaproteobacteria bacterium]|nr:nitroreductase family protein [Deltaproteobacteria bacterium]